MTVTVIRGTSSGIGLATAKRLSRSGRKVYAGVRNPDTADELKTAIAEANGAISLLEIDVNDETSAQSAIDGVMSEEGKIDVLVNNAGMCAVIPRKRRHCRTFAICSRQMSLARSPSRKQ